LADFYIWATIYGLIPSGESLPRAEAAARRAIELDEHLGEAYASLGLTKLSRFSWQEAERLYQKALELAPNYVHAHEWWAAQLVGHGNFAEGAREIRIAERLDPLSLRTKTLVAWTLYQAHRFEEALEIARQIVDLDKNYPQGYAQLGNNLRQLGKTDEAVANYRKFNEMIPDSALAKCSLCHMLAAAGQTDEARQILNEMQTLASVAYVKPYFLGLAQAAVGERDAAFANFEKAVAENDPWMLWFGTEPLLDAVRDDERYLALMRRMNLPLLDHNTKGQS
jgi:tetratricopeptide (TPR) repeat protein